MNLQNSKIKKNEKNSFNFNDIFIYHKNQN